MHNVHLRGQTPETLAAAFPGLPLPVARRVLHRVVGEDRDRLVFEGDSFDGIKVLRIGEAEVEVEIRGQRRVLRF